jgi:FKBP-type peptidyl-prolyl cis-trans isomerase SlyD
MRGPRRSRFAFGSTTWHLAAVAGRRVVAPAGAVMRIEQNKLVALDYVLTLDSGEIVDKSEGGDPLLFLHGQGGIIPGLERQLDGLETGSKADITVEAEEGYGPVRADLVQKLPKKHFPDEVAAGMSFEAQGAHGPVVLQVREVAGDTVLVDLNHPLAGKRLHFNVHVADVREPTEEDLQMFAGGCSENDCGGECHCK